jgi:DNA processing protein
MWREENPEEKIESELSKENVSTIAVDEHGYPPLLKEINDPPICLFYRGQIPKKDTPTVAIVGTRKNTTYGKIACEEMSHALAQHGIIVVSGLALGLDAIAHQTCVDANGVTLAILGSGVNKQNIYPTANKLLAEKIIERGGAVISEYPIGFLPTQYSFPARNRIIAGLSLGVIIIEAPSSSGALITAKHALDYNREVMAIPHPITSINGAGPNNLIKMGAKLISEPEDIFETLNLQIIKQTQLPNIKQKNSPIEEQILKCLSNEPKNINQLILESKLNSASANSTLMMLEIKGVIKNLGGMNYALVNKSVK